MKSNSDRVFIKDSSIQGRGLFARRDFKKGEIVLGWSPSNKYLSEVEIKGLSGGENHYIALYNNRYLLIAEPERFMNHSCNPNTETRENGVDYALRDIEVGEEITGDYEKEGTLLGFSCNCGSLNCRGAIRGSLSNPSSNITHSHFA